MEFIIIFLRQYIDLLKDLIKITILEYFPNKIFVLFYSLALVKRLRTSGYSEPNFIKTEQLVSKVESKIKGETIFLNNQIKQYHQSIDFTENPPKSNKLISPSNTNEIAALVIIPAGWLNPDSNEGKTQGPQIDFLIEGLRSNGIEVETFEVRKKSNNFIFLESRMTEFDLIFIWSLTVNSSDGELFTYLHEIAKIQLSASKVIGVITASPSKHRLIKYKKWAQVLTAVIYYEENSDYRTELEKIIRTIHVPLLQITSIDTSIATKFTPSVHSSSLLKYNRASWLMTLRYQSLALGLKYHIRAMSTPLSDKGFRKLYLSSSVISNQRSGYGFGFVMIHRSQHHDAHLIGSFWDYYRLGVIPILQMQEIRSVASYMQPYLDYFPITSDQELFMVLSLGKNSPDLFDELRKRILLRMQIEFSPKMVISNLLLDVNQ
jgi:hypothetical protein